MSAHAAHTVVGDEPIRISTAKTLQPRHRPKADSSSAAPASSPTTTQAAPWAPTPNHSTTAVVENTTPMAWAKRLGGPATGRGATGSRGATTRVASWPSGLRVGPVSTRAQKP